MAARKPKQAQARLFSRNALKTFAGRRRRALFLPKYVDEAFRKAHHLHGRLPALREVVSKWARMELEDRLESKETSLDAEFLHEIFGALGFTVKTQGDRYTLERQFAVQGVGQADGAIGDFPLAPSGQPVAVIELKGARIDLDHDRSNGRTAVQQLWDYLNALPDCEWGILSNFSTIRLYHRDRTPLAYEEFELQSLAKETELNRFFCLFEHGAFLRSAHKQPPRLAGLLDQSSKRQRTVGDDLYEAYHRHRLRLIDHLHREQEKPLDTAIRITQKLLDRIVFIAFCEDRGLLPENLLDKAYKDIPAFSKARNPRWQNFLGLFTAIDKGMPQQRIDAFNGGLFAHDPEVDDLDLSDDWIGFFQEVGRYDFRDEVNVDVLGHLFERSITELERLRMGGLFAVEQAKGEVDAPAPKMKKSAQRKRGGVYYTPPELTGLIVERVVGALARERREALAAAHGVDLSRDAENSEKKALAFWRAAFGDLRSMRIIDPACGSGAFLIRAYDELETLYAEVVEAINALGYADESRELADSIPDTILANNLYGVDLSPDAVEITQLALWIRSAREKKTLNNLSANIIAGDSLIDEAGVSERPLKWAEAFPAILGPSVPEGRRGFDCVIGNPPWERMKLQEREFFSMSAPDIASAVSAATRRNKIEKLRSAKPGLYELYARAQAQAEAALNYARRSGRYPLTGKGDINLYALFAELAMGLVSPTGVVGLLVPSGIATDNSTRRFFASLLKSQRLSTLYDFENKRPFFPDVHRSFKFSALIFGGVHRVAESADFVFFARSGLDVDEPKRHIELTAKDIALLNPNTKTCPIFRTRRDADLTKSIYRRVPVLLDRTRKTGGNPWGVSFLRMFDQTNDAELFTEGESLRKRGYALEGARWVKGKKEFLPLYEAKMVQAYDHRAASVVVAEENWVRQGQTEDTTVAQHQNPEFVALPRWWVERREVEERLKGAVPTHFIGFKDITSPTNSRTMIASAIPPSGVTNHFPLVRVEADARLSACLLGNLNSFVLDYATRQKIGAITLNFFIVEQLPILPPEQYAEACPWSKKERLVDWISERVLRLTCTSLDMRDLAAAAGFTGSTGKGVQRWSLQERAELRAELDAAFLVLYGVNRDDAEYLLSTFQVASKPFEGLFGESVGESVLKAYDELVS